MRHRKKTVKLGRTTAHRDAMLSNQVASLIEHERIKTTLAKAKAVRPIAEKMVTLGKRGDLHARRQAAAFLGEKLAVKKLFETVAPRSASRNGGYTRIIKLGPRLSDSAPMAFIEFVDRIVEADDSGAIEVPTAKATKETVSKKAGSKPAAKAPKAEPVAKKPKAEPAEKPAEDEKSAS